MTVEIPYTSREAWLQARTKDITSTEVAALFGLSPYMTHLELWFQKKNETIVELQENDRMKWGNRLQDSIARGIAQDNGWEIRTKSEYMRDEEHRMGSSFDYEVLVDIKHGLLEIKNVDSLILKNEWILTDENEEAPPHIELQVQHQLAVSGLEFAHIGALVGGNRVILIRRDRDEKVIAAIRAKVADFWQSIEENTPPEFNFERDADFIAQLYGAAEPGKVIEADAQILELAKRYREFGEQEKVATTGKKAVKAEILTLIGDAEKVLGNGFSISASTVGPAIVETYERAPYRSFRVNWRKG